MYLSRYKCDVELSPDLSFPHPYITGDKGSATCFGHNFGKAIARLWSFTPVEGLGSGGKENNKDDLPPCGSRTRVIVIFSALLWSWPFYLLKKKIVLILTLCCCRAGRVLL